MEVVVATLAVALLLALAYLAALILGVRARDREAEALAVRLRNVTGNLTLVVAERDDLAERLDDAERLAGELDQQLHAAPSAAAAPMTPEQRAAVEAGRCVHCGGTHARSCPRVRRIRFRADGQTPLEVEYWSDQEWPHHNIIWPESLYQEVPS